MESKQRKTFRIATDELNFTQTAEILNYLQSNVTPNTVIVSSRF